MRGLPLLFLLPLLPAMGPSSLLVLSGLTHSYSAPRHQARKKRPGQKIPAKKKLSQLIKQLGNSMDSGVRYAAYRELIRTRPLKAVPLLVKALPTFSRDAQSLAISLLQGYPRDLSTPAFRKLLRCGTPLVELGAATALHRFGDKSMGKLIAKMLAKAPRHASTRLLMLSRLSYVRDAQVQAAVRAFLVPGIGSSELDAVLYHLLLVNDPLAADAAMALYKSEGMDTRSRQYLEVFLLARGRKVEGSEIVKTLATTRDFYRLQRYLSRADHLDRPVLAAVAEYLENNQGSSYARYAIEILAKHRYSKALPVIRKLVDSSNSLVSKAALAALSDLGGLSERSSLYQLLGSDRPEIVLSAADTLRRLDDQAGLAHVIEILKKGGRTRSEAVRILGEFRSPKAVFPLLAAMEDKDITVRSHALTGLGKVLRCLYPYKRIDLASTGYSVSAGPTKRALAVASLRAWWGGLQSK